MNKDFVQKQKEDFRLHLKQKRKLIPFMRRQQASLSAHSQIDKLCKAAHLVLSYASFDTELDLWPLNEQLAKENRLVLPKIEKQQLQLFLVQDLTNLKPNRWHILEPNPLICPRIAPHSIDLTLVPGLGFDPNSKHRLGYGKGYYDRLIKQISQPGLCYGIGFKEQIFTPLPFSELDVPLSQHWLF